MNDLISLGWNPSLSLSLENGAAPARVAIAERGQFWLLGLAHPIWAPCTPRMLKEAEDARGLPVVGDWVAVKDGFITEVLERTSLFVRKAAGQHAVPQPICANVDTVFVVTAVGIDLNERRLDRYLVAVGSTGATPVIVVNKTDLTENLSEVKAELAGTASRVSVVYVSAQEGNGLDGLSPYLVPGQTVALVGSSGVGKSSLVNRLLGEAHLLIGDVSDADGKGQHTTTRRELVQMASGALLIDTPGMREFGLWEAEVGLSSVFSDVEAFAGNCHFRDCGHDDEPGCGVKEAIAKGQLAATRFDSYQHLQRENAYHARRAGEGVQKGGAQPKEKWKKMSKGMRERKKLNRNLGLKDW